MWAARVDEGYLFGELTDDAVRTLRGVPMLIESSDDRVRRRLLPETCHEEEDEAHWREHAVPELERLFLSRAHLVQRDLDKLRRLPDTEGQVLLISHEHVNAWLAALNAARLALFELNDLTAAHMETEGFSGASAKQQEAIIRISLLAEIQAVLLGDFEVDDEDASADDLTEG
ncbi:MAG: DUF2017 family protein [Planctomycetota bacterium]|nr:DUF2017 family protein [Planctomycetota bacterium]